MTTLVFLNEETQIITIVSNKRVVELHWSSIDEISSLIADQEVLYVTNAEMVPGFEVINLLAELSGGRSPSEAPAKSTKTYIRSLTSGKLVCKTNAGELVFEGPKDIKDLAFLPHDIIEQSEHLQICLKARKVEIIDEVQKRQVLEEINQQSKKARKSRDTAIDKILIKTSVDDFINRDRESSDDFPEIDVSSTGSFKKENDQEIYANLKRIGRDVSDI